MFGAFSFLVITQEALLIHLLMQNGRVSPRTPQTVEPASVLSRSNKEQQGPAIPNPPLRSPQEQTSSHHSSIDAYNAKIGRYEAMASQGYGGGIPAKIEEGIEPDDGAQI